MIKVQDGNVRWFIWDRSHIRDIFPETPTRLSEFCIGIWSFLSQGGKADSRTSMVKWCQQYGNCQSTTATMSNAPITRRRLPAFNAALSRLRFCKFHPSASRILTPKIWPCIRNSESPIAPIKHISGQRYYPKPNRQEFCSHQGRIAARIAARSSAA